MVSVSKEVSQTSTVTEKGRVLGAISRGRLLRAGVRVPNHISGDPQYEYTRKQTVKGKPGTRTEILTEEQWRVTY